MQSDLGRSAAKKESIEFFYRKTQKLEPGSEDVPVNRIAGRTGRAANPALESRTLPP